MIKEEFATTLVQLRKASGKTQKQLSRESGVSFRFLQEIEAGEKQPTITTLFNLAAALDSTAAKLITSAWEKWLEAGQPDK